MKKRELVSGAFCVLSSLVACSAPDGVESSSSDSIVSAIGTTYQVGPGKPYPDLQSVASRLAPGDVVEVYAKGSAYTGGVVFSRPGTAANKITIRGVRVNGARPVISGGYNTVQFDANYYVFEGFEITNGSVRNVFHHAHDVTINDTSVHDCVGHGILGADSGSGSLSLNRVEVYACGSGTTKHPVYMATDETMYPGSVFRMTNSYLHDQRGGNAVKSRAERNEIRSNWIEGGFYREIELIGPDGQAASLRREDSDVVGNVFFKTQGTYVARIGGDGTGATSGRYRFANNTFVLQPSSPAVIQVFDQVETLEMHNNAFYRLGGGGVQVVNSSNAIWTAGRPVMSGQGNWIPGGSSGVPAEWTGTRTGSSPGFVNASARDVRLAAASPLIDAGSATTSSPAGYAFPSPLSAPALLPPLHTITSDTPRPVVGSLDIGAFEYGTESAPAPTPTPDPTPAPTPTACVGPQPGFVTTSIGSQTGTFSVTADVTPSAAGIDSAIAVSRGTPTSWTGLAAIVLFDPSGRVLARNGSTYAAQTSLSYAASVTYKVRFAIDMTRHTYSAFVTPAGQSEVTIGSNFAFRPEQATITSADGVTLATDSSSGGLKVCNITN